MLVQAKLPFFSLIPAIIASTFLIGFVMRQTVLEVFNDKESYETSAISDRERDEQQHKNVKVGKEHHTKVGFQRPITSRDSES